MATMLTIPTQASPANWTPFMTRYSNAYRVANAITTMAAAVKIIAIAAGVILFLVGMSGASSIMGAASLILGVIAAVIVGGGGFILRPDFRPGPGPEGNTGHGG
jgi:hypothetical protein